MTSGLVRCRHRNVLHLSELHPATTQFHHTVAASQQLPAPISSCSQVAASEAAAKAREVAEPLRRQIRAPHVSQADLWTSDPQLAVFIAAVLDTGLRIVASASCEQQPCARERGPQQARAALWREHCGCLINCALRDTICVEQTDISGPSKEWLRHQLAS